MNIDNVQPKEELKDDIPINGAMIAKESMEVENTSGGISVNMPEFLKAKTGEGSIESYLDHPLNFNNDKGLARIIRGATGMLGALDLAIIDIAIGFMEFMKGRGKGASA